MFNGAVFGAFELDIRKRELRKHGIRIRLPDQSFEILVMLAEHAEEVVTREDIRSHLWPDGTVVEFEHSMNSALKRLRDALGDSATSPRFIETVPRHGYVFIAPVQRLGPFRPGSRYRLLEEAGRGSMGVVYRAEDLRLGRQVALKFLPEQLAAQPLALNQLRQKAHTASLLNHQNICTLHGIEEHDGCPCLVMEYLEGVTLGRLVEAGPLPAHQVLDFAIQVCSALEAAHASGMVHQDLKPSNLFVCAGGQIKVADFGFATGAGERLTQGGTPGYQSPEQIRGKVPDERSNIFSLGAVLLHMITGYPTPGMATELPRELDSVIAHCLEAEPANRYQSAATLRAALEEARLGMKAASGRHPKRWRATGSITLALVLMGAGVTWKYGIPTSKERLPIRSIAVLPLVNLSGDVAQDYLADGMTEVLTSDLAELGSLRVTSRTSAMTYKGSHKPLPAIANDLKVDALLEGSVSRSGERVRIVAQLIQASTDTHVWSKTYESNLQDVLRVQGELAQAIADAVKAAITPSAKARLAAKPLVKPAAYEAYLKGMYHLNKFTPAGFETGMAYLVQATDADPGNPFAYAGLALGYSMLGHDRYPDAFGRAKAAALRSLELGGPLAEAYVALGMVDLYADWNLATAGKDLRRALEINPNLAEARRHFSWYLRLLGRREESLLEMKHAETLEPLVPLFAADLAWQYLNDGHLDEAMAEAHKSLELNPNFSQALAVTGWVYLEQNRYAAALEAHQKAASSDPAWRFALGQTYALGGRKEEARQIAAELKRNPGPMDQWGLAAIYASLGDKDEAFRWLEAAFRSRFSWMPWNSDVSRRQELFASLREDPRFDALNKRVLGFLPSLR